MKKVLFFATILTMGLWSCGGGGNQQRAEQATTVEDVIKIEDDGMGIWAVAYFLDEFGYPTDDRFMGNDLRILGTFQNTAVRDADLGVRFIILPRYPVLRHQIAVRLYEHNRNNPAIRDGFYEVLVQDGSGERHRLSASSSRGLDRLNIGWSFDSEREKMYDILMNGGLIRVLITHSRHPAISYSFSFYADGFAEAYANLIAE